MADHVPYWDPEELHGTVCVAAKCIEKLLDREHMMKIRPSIDKMISTAPDSSRLLYEINHTLMLSLNAASAGCMAVGIHGTAAWLSKLQTHQAILIYAMQHLLKIR
jgi:hypothetical protein